jgi:hypothetical protein
VGKPAAAGMNTGCRPMVSECSGCCCCQ